MPPHRSTSAAPPGSRSGSGVRPAVGAPARRGLAVLVVDSNRRLLMANKYARSLLEAGRVFVLRDGRVDSAGDDNASYFRRLVRRGATTSLKSAKPGTVRLRDEARGRWADVIVAASPASSGWTHAAMIVLDTQ